MIIEIIEEDRAKCGDYVHSGKCLLSTALKRKGYEAESYFSSVRMLGKEFDMSVEDARIVHAGYYTLDDVSCYLRPYLRSFPFTVELIEIPF
jgi:hypothetical protein